MQSKEGQELRRGWCAQQGDDIGRRAERKRAIFLLLQRLRLPLPPLLGLLLLWMVGQKLLGSATPKWSKMRKRRKHYRRK
ncbi:membrane-associated protein, putative [Bodo saltans]|uniref:Membrane-associated protein, putative n=1 Tax=Bodo saltans TaxID=75058 RepID=A0A0S4J7M6_BODSA|nr:membrane-associated protein, putative [Bodo saltans]|eukprot:CUG85975.1 membrane-associated protein, putative [Bodo saltans]